MMTLFVNRTEAEQEIIRNAYNFEIQMLIAVENETVSEDLWSLPNPYFKEIKAMGLWEALNEAVEMAWVF